MTSRLARGLGATLLLLVAALTLAAWQWSRSSPAASPGARPPVAPGGTLIGSVRSEPGFYNRFVSAQAGTQVVALLTQARLVRVDRASDLLEPWLAERWSASPDGLTYTLTLRRGVTFSDGMPFTAADVLFSFRAAYDPALNSPIGATLQVAGQPLAVAAPDPHTVVVRLPGPFAPGLRLLENLPILPQHRLAAALDAGTFRDEWTPARPLETMAGLGPFVLSEHVSGQRLVFTRNPHYWRRDARGAALPYLDSLTLLVIPDQNTEALRLQAGEIDFMASGEIRPQDYAAFQRLAAAGRLRLTPVGTGLDPDLLWFNLTGAGPQPPGRALLARQEFRQAISLGVDRQALVNGVYLGAAQPIFGPVSPGNSTWFAPDASPAGHDPARARTLLASLGLADRDNDGTLEDARGIPARFSILTQADHIRARTAAALQEQLRQLGIVVDVVTLDARSIVARFEAGDYDSIYFGIQASATDPALNPEFWLSSGAFHFWHPKQAAPATPWEKRIDELMLIQAQAPELGQRQRAFAEVQRILGGELPAIWFLAPRVSVATTMRVVNGSPVLQVPQLLWSAETLAAAPAAGARQ